MTKVSLVPPTMNDRHVAMAFWTSTDKDSDAFMCEESEVERVLRMGMKAEPVPHGSPFGHPHITFKVDDVPLFVVHQWQRHRVQNFCLAGDTSIPYLHPNGTTAFRTIRQLYELKHGGVVDRLPERVKNGLRPDGTQIYIPNPRLRDAEWRRRVLPNCQNRILRSLDEATLLPIAGAMRDVFATGTKEVFSVATERGHAIKVSAQHRFLTPEGWAEAQDLRVGDRVSCPRKIGLEPRACPERLRQGIGIWAAQMRPLLIREWDACYICLAEFSYEELELDHVVPVVADISRALDETNLRPACVPCHYKKTGSEQKMARRKLGLGNAWVKLSETPQLVGEEPTYDIEMEGPNHNYTANGFIVHNSEKSHRYVEGADKFYMPELTDIRTQVGRPGRYTFEPMAEDASKDALAEMEYAYCKAYYSYQQLIKAGVAQELARTVLPSGLLTRMYATASLRNWLNFLVQRNDSHAQLEIRQCAEQVEAILTGLFPITMRLWVEYGRRVV